MTEAEWLVSTDLWEMLRHTQKWASERKLRLLAVACCHCLDEILQDETIIEALSVAEMHAEGEIHSDTLDVLSGQVTAAIEQLEQLGHSLISPQRQAYGLVEATTRTGNYVSALADVAGATSQALASGTGEFWGTEPWEAAQQQAAKFLASLVRDILGNPFWPIDFNAKWRTTDVALLANGIYAEQAFDRMPILADALQDAGCDAENLLAHLRDPNATHVRGCWALDLVLGKE